MNDKRSLRIIDSPPPFLSGNLHMGHFYQWAYIDVLSYYLNGKPVNQNIGFDIHGLPFELKQKQLGLESKVLYSLLSTKMKTELTNILLAKPHFWNTGSLKYNQLMKNSLKYLFSKDLIYRKERFSNYCPHCKTHLSESETSSHNLKKDQYFFKTKEGYEVMTTMPSWTSRIMAVSKNKLDPRYIGLEKITLFDGRIIKVYEDETVILQKGTGLVFVCGTNNQKDLLFVEKRNLIEDAKRVMNNPLLTENQLNMLIEKQEVQVGSQIDCTVKIHSERSSCKKEIHKKNNYQLFLKVEKFKKYFLENVENLKISPSEHKHYLTNWVEKLEDWCISRQYNNGYCFPLYGKDEQLSMTKKKGYVKLEDKLDCWFETGHTFLFQKNHFQVPLERMIRVQGYQIARTWLLSTYIIGYFLDFDFNQYSSILTGLILNKDGKKFSKSNNSTSLSFNNPQALRLWAISFLPSKKEKRSSLEEISLFEERVNSLSKIFTQRYKRETIDNLELTEKIKRFYELSSQHRIDYELLMKIKSFYPKNISKRQELEILKIFYPFIKKY